MNKIVSTKKTISLFLAAVLVAGTIALSSPSFITGVNAQYEPKYGMDTGYNSYASQYPQEYKDKNNYNNYGPDYPPKYTDDRKYNSYKPQYYEMDNNDRKSYENDNGYDKSQYSSYKSDYTPKYPSYGKDDRTDKSKDDSSKSVDINKIKCINNNLNINGNNAGNVSLGNKGAAEGYLDDYSSTSSSGYGNERYYDDGYDNKKDKDFDCIINNNNNNTNVVSGEAGNVTDGNVIEITCEECFEENLSAQTFVALNAALTSATGVTITIGGQTTVVNSLEELCDVLEGNSALDVFSVLNTQFGGILGTGNAVDIVVCLGQILDFLI